MSTTGRWGMTDFHEGELIVYQCGEHFEIGRIKRLTPEGAFIWYHSGDSASRTPYVRMHKLENAHVIESTTLGGGGQGGEKA